MYGGTNPNQKVAAATTQVTISTLRDMRERGEKIACLTAYDAAYARAEDEAGVDLILVGDSLGMVVQGFATTLPVTEDDIAYHCRCVARGLATGAGRPFLLADMPFLGDASCELALMNAGRLLKGGVAKMVKLEGGANQLETVRTLAEYGVPVCAHLGLKPQQVHKLGGFRAQGRDAESAAAMRESAQAMVEAGADMLLLECVPAELGAQITEAAGVPVIGIGAGPDTDGQILVINDVLGVTPGRKPKFVRDFMADAHSIQGALEAYVAAVKSGSYPAPEHCFK